ncbi:cyclophilin-like protein [Calocera viscosa TUFC12733]|uniref:Cyclophilin-like protein n=1 Tax=Calocera viscosa (strain TUFC12733) TaxID=1330018 RepID=A0A167RJ07_CALVF|nr:cyclophilin-like protein [Calocera viscosa TUFC12733]
MSTLLPPNGRVLLDTTVGDIEIELWSKECPKACRNLIALALEGYYDGVIFHRVVPGFLVQTGDRTGTGSGGESFYGEPFESEPHPRLRWTHRGLVGCAGGEGKDLNDSQFFITLDRTDELQNKNTLFGRVVGDTIYNVLKIGQVEIDSNGRPKYPPRINTIKILDNPFDDIVPRITAAERQAQARAKADAAKTREEQERRKGAKKDVKLLSFGADAEEEEAPTFKKKAIVRPDLVEDPTAAKQMSIIAGPPSGPSQSKPAAAPQAAEAEKSNGPKKSKKDKEEEEDEDVLNIRAKHAKEQAAEREAREAEVRKLVSSVKSLTRKRSLSPDPSADRKKPKGPSALEQELAKYEAHRGKGGLTVKAKSKGRREEDSIMSKLATFQNRLHRFMPASPSPPPVEPRESATNGDEAREEAPADAVEEDVGEEMDTDKDWLGHALHFEKGGEEETRRAEADYEVIDPRARARWAKDERKEERRGGGGRGGGGRRR